MADQSSCGGSPVVTLEFKSTYFYGMEGCENNRRDIVQYLVHILNSPGNGFGAYNPNEGDSSEWVLDVGNNWRVSFHRDRPKAITLTTRYSLHKMQMLKNWLIAWYECREILVTH